MVDLQPRYRREGDAWLIEIELRVVNQLFNSLDPSPFHERDLDDDAETWIVGAARELPLHAPIKLVLHLPEAELTPQAGSLVRSALSSYFNDRAAIASRDLSYLFHRGRIALAIGLSFLAACLVARGVAMRVAPQGWSELVAEGLLIVGWVAMWRPLEIFLYDWWPLRRMVLLHRKLAAMPIELRARGGH